MEELNKQTKILILEDEIEFQETLKKIYKRSIEAGMIKWEWATNGEEGINKAETIKPEILVVDLDLPIINGFQVISALNSKDYIQKIIPYTGKFEEEQIKQLKDKYEKIQKYYIKSKNKPKDLLETIEIRKDDFNYEELSPELQEFIKEKTNNIKQLMKLQVENVVKMGWELEQVKKRLKWGEYEKWLENEFYISSSTARKYIKTAKEFHGIENIDELNISNTAAYALAQNNTPKEVKDELIRRAREGEFITPKIVKKTLKYYEENHPKEIIDVKGKTVNTEKAKIIRIINEQYVQLGKHTLYKGPIYHERFLTQLPKKINLFIAFLSPTETLEIPPQLAIDEIVTFQSKSHPEENEGNWEEIIKLILENLTDVNDNIVINRLPSHEVLITIDMIGCTGYISEDSKIKAESFIEKWKEYKANPRQIKEDIIEKYEERIELDQQYIKELREQL